MYLHCPPYPNTMAFALCVCVCALRDGSAPPLPWPDAEVDGTARQGVEVIITVVANRALLVLFGQRVCLRERFRADSSLPPRGGGRSSSLGWWHRDRNSANKRPGDQDIDIGVSEAVILISLCILCISVYFCVFEYDVYFCVFLCIPVYSYLEGAPVFRGTI